MKKYIVITTINKPTEAIHLFAKLPFWNVIVVADKKTPVGWEADNVKFLSCEEQEFFSLKLPYNNYVRKMIGYLYAMQQGATHIAESDDDNYPRLNWGFPNYEGEVSFFDKTEYDLVSGNGFVNIYKYFTQENIWARGFPLNEINSINNFTDGKFVLGESVGVWQGLVDGDPDVDAIYRLTCGKEIQFDQRSPIILGKNVFSPFNSQNTFFKKPVFALMYLPVTVNQRFADILRSYVAQPIMWESNYLLGFVSPNAVQIRNDHDLMEDFVDEIPMYLNVKKAYSIARRAVKTKAKITDNLFNVYSALVDAGIVLKKEMKYLESWILGVEFSNEKD